MTTLRMQIFYVRNQTCTWKYKLNTLQLYLKSVKFYGNGFSTRTTHQKYSMSSKLSRMKSFVCDDKEKLSSLNPLKENSVSSTQSTSNTRCVDFSSQISLQFSIDTNGKSCSSILRLPGVSTDTACSVFSPTRLPCPISNANFKFQCVTYTCDLQLAINQAINPDPLLMFDNLPEQLTKLKKVPYLLLPIYYNVYNSEAAKWKRCIEQE